MATLCAQMPALAMRRSAVTPPQPPLKGKLVFLDTKAPVAKLRQQLEILGARVETFFSKDIWCVITDKHIHEDNKQLLASAATTARRTPFLNRTQVLLQAAQQKEAKKKDDELQTVVQECKQWDIPLLSIKTASTSVLKLMKKYQPAGPNVTPPRKSSGTTLLRKSVSESHLGKTTRLQGDEILKLEDRKQLYKPLYKTFTKQDYPRMNVSPTTTSTTSLYGFTLQEANSSPHKVDPKRDQPPDDTQPKRPAVETKENGRKRKLDSKHAADAKSKYCEICHEYFVNLRSHLNSSGHVRVARDTLKDLEKIVGEFQNDFFEKSSEEAPRASPKRRRVNTDRDIASIEL